MRTLSTVCLLALATALARGDDWSHLGRDDARSRTPAETLVAPVTSLWNVSTGASATASPVAVDGFLITAGEDGRVRAWRESDGASLWSASTGGTIASTPVVSRGRVFAPNTDGKLSCYRLADGALLWTLETHGTDQSSPVLSGTTLYLGQGFPNTKALAVDTSLAAVKWQAPLEQISYSSPALAGGKVILGCGSGRFYALDASTGAESWNYATGGDLSHSSPLVDGSAIYALSNATLYRFDLDSSQWGVANWSLAVTDPAPPAALAVDWASSSPVKAGGFIVFLLRFNYHLDNDANGQPDARRLREFAVAVNPAPAQAVVWRTLLSDTTVADFTGIPPYKLCPTPVPNGTAEVVCASSLDASLRILAAADGSLVSSFALSGACLASPMTANGRVYALTRGGDLHAFQGTNVPPGAVTGLSPAGGVVLDAAPSTLNWNAAEAGATYTVRVDDDGEALMDWDYEYAVTGTSVAGPALSVNGTTYTWAVRARDADGARGPWSAPATFRLVGRPDPPSGFSAAPRHQKVDLSWTASPTAGVTGYRLACTPSGGATTTVDLSNVTRTTVYNLTNGTAYAFELKAVNGMGLYSTPVSASATPVSLISLGDRTYDTLQEALAVARRGETVSLGADTFVLSSPLELPPGVRLEGVNAWVTRLEAQGAFDMITAMRDSKVRFLSLSGGNVGVRVRGAGVHVGNCVIRNMSDAGVLIEHSCEADVINNTIVRNVAAGIRSTGRSFVRNNILQENGVGCQGKKLTSRYNDVSDGYSGCRAGRGDIRRAVAFRDASSGDYRESAGQPSIDAGDPRDDYSREPHPNGRRINMGAFGNTPLAAPSP